jgi:hypothetical protein
MAVLDYSLLANFSGFFLWLLIFLVAYGLLRMTDMLKLGNDSKIYSLIAFVLAFLLLLSDIFTTILTYALPWLMILILVAFFLLFFAKMMNPDLDASKILGEGLPQGLLITFTVIIFLFAMGAALGDDVLEAQTGVDISQLSEAELAAGETIPENTFVPAEQLSNAGSAATLDRRTNIANTIFHPNVLGMLLLLLISMTAIFTLAK